MHWENSLVFIVHSLVNSVKSVSELVKENSLQQSRTDKIRSTALSSVLTCVVLLIVQSFVVGEKQNSL